MHDAACRTSCNIIIAVVFEKDDSASFRRREQPTISHNVVNTKGLIVYHPETNSASSDKHGTGTTKEELLCQVENNGEESEGARQDRQCIKTARHR